MTIEPLLLFGGDLDWQSEDWTASDDRVRGGKSQSYLTISGSTAEFNGVLDIKTLGGAGFASQRTTGDDRVWDLSKYDGIELCVAKADDKQYTFILKDEILPQNPDGGREQSTISYEYDFAVSSGSSPEDQPIFIAWDKLKPTYRGKEKKDAPELSIKKIKRMSIMMRSFFGNQEGDFSLILNSIKARTEPSSMAQSTRMVESTTGKELPVNKEGISDSDKGLEPQIGQNAEQGLLSKFMKCFRL